jgi:hypothetical protein
MFAFVGSFKDFPPRSSPPSFNPANIMEYYLKGHPSDQDAGTTIPNASARSAKRRTCAGNQKEEVANDRVTRTTRVTSVWCCAF